MTKKNFCKEIIITLFTNPSSSLRFSFFLPHFILFYEDTIFTTPPPPPSQDGQELSMTYDIAKDCYYEKVWS